MDYNRGERPQLNLCLIGGFWRLIKILKDLSSNSVSLFGASCFSKYNIPPLEKLTLTECFHHCPLLFPTLCHFSWHDACLTIILLPLFQQNGSSGIDLESMFSSLSISFCDPDRRLFGRAEKRGRISFMRTSKEIHISFWIREALDGNLIAGFKRSDCDHHTFSAQLKFVDTNAFVNSSWSEKCTLFDPAYLKKNAKGDRGSTATEDTFGHFTLRVSVVDGPARMNHTPFRLSRLQEHLRC